MQLPWRRGDSWPRVERVLVGTDRSETAERAVQWAADMAERYEAELVVLQVLADGADAQSTTAALQSYVQEVAPRGRAIVRAGDDPARVIVDAATEEGVDVIVVGSVGMSGRKEFLLENVPNRVSHNAPCTVVIVNTHGDPKRKR